jgi:hypothetical protein
MDYLMIILQAVGNVMAGIMLKTIKSCRPGYYNTVGDHLGRITTMGLLTEVNRLLDKWRELTPARWTPCTWPASRSCHPTS